MLPAQLAKSGTEHAHQRAFFQWLNFAARWGFGVGKLVAEGQVGGKLADCAGGAEPLPALALMHAIPNGGMRDPVTAGKLKAEGVKAGVLDTFLPVPKIYYAPATTMRPDGGLYPAVAHMYMGLYIEFKDPKRRNHKEGGLSPEQVAFMGNVREQGYCCRVAYTWQEAANLVMAYYLVDTRIDTT